MATTGQVAQFGSGAFGIPIMPSRGSVAPDSGPSASMPAPQTNAASTSDAAIPISWVAVAGVLIVMRIAHERFGTQEL